VKQFQLTNQQFQELMRLSRLYRRDADRCMKGKSYLSGCVMIGAALVKRLPGSGLHYYVLRNGIKPLQLTKSDTK